MTSKISHSLVVSVLAILVLAGVSRAQEDQGVELLSETVTTVRETTTTVKNQSGKPTNTQRLAAIFVKNRAGDNFDEKIEVLEELVTAEVTDMGFAIMSPSDTVKAVRSYMKIEPGQDLPGDQLDELLENNTSALRLGQNMGADYLFIVSLATFGSDSQQINRPDLGINRRIVTTKLRTTYKVLDAGLGESISAGTTLSTERQQATEGFAESSDVVNDLLADAARQIAQILRKKGGAEALAESKKSDRMVAIEIACSMQDMMIPEVIEDKEGNYQITGNRYKLEPLAVTVELDGVVIGTAPNIFNVLPGLHKIRLTREGFQEWERTINLREGQFLNVALTLSDEGRADWMEMAKFFNNMKREERMTAAQGEYVRSVAQMMRQSGVRIDKRSDVKMDADDVSNVNLDVSDGHNVETSVWPLGLPSGAVPSLD